MNWITQPGWILTWHEWEDARILGVLVANHGEEAAIAKLKDVARRHRHPRGGKNNLEWRVDGKSFKAAGLYDGHLYAIEPYTVEVLS